MPSRAEPPTAAWTRASGQGGRHGDKRWRAVGDFAYAIGLQSDGKIGAGWVVSAPATAPALPISAWFASRPTVGSTPTTGEATTATVLFDAGFGGWDEARRPGWSPGDDSVVVAVPARGRGDIQVHPRARLVRRHIGTASGRSVSHTTSVPFNDYVRAVALQPDGSIVVVGQARATVNDFGGRPLHARRRPRRELRHGGA